MAIHKPIAGVNRAFSIAMIIGLFTFCNVSAQRIKMPCHYLQKIIESKEFERYNEYYISEKPIDVFDEKVDSFVFKMPKDVFKSDTINLIDFTNTFSNCNAVKWHSYIINITDKNPRKYNPLKYDRDASNMDLVIEKIKKIKSEYIVFFWDPLSNSHIEISICKRKGKYIIKELSTGSY